MEIIGLGGVTALSGKRAGGEPVLPVKTAAFPLEAFTCLNEAHHILERGVLYSETPGCHV